MSQYALQACLALSFLGSGVRGEKVDFVLALTSGLHERFDNTGVHGLWMAETTSTEKYHSSNDWDVRQNRARKCFYDVEHMSEDTRSKIQEFLNKPENNGPLRNLMQNDPNTPLWKHELESHFGCFKNMYAESGQQTVPNRRVFRLAEHQIAEIYFRKAMQLETQFYAAVGCLDILKPGQQPAHERMKTLRKKVKELKDTMLQSGGGNVQTQFDIDILKTEIQDLEHSEQYTLTKQSKYQHCLSGEALAKKAMELGFVFSKEHMEKSRTPGFGKTGEFQIEVTYDTATKKWKFANSHAQEHVNQWKVNNPQGVKALNVQNLSSMKIFQGPDNGNYTLVEFLGRNIDFAHFNEVTSMANIFLGPKRFLRGTKVILQNIHPDADIRVAHRFAPLVNYADPSQLNGCVGEIMNYGLQSEKYLVKLENIAELYLSPENVFIFGENPNVNHNVQGLDELGTVAANEMTFHQWAKFKNKPCLSAWQKRAVENRGYTEEHMKDEQYWTDIFKGLANPIPPVA